MDSPKLAISNLPAKSGGLDREAANGLAPARATSNQKLKEARLTANIRTINAILTIFSSKNFLMDSSGPPQPVKSGRSGRLVEGLNDSPSFLGPSRDGAGSGSDSGLGVDGDEDAGVGGAVVDGGAAEVSPGVVDEVDMT